MTTKTVKIFVVSGVLPPDQRRTELGIFFKVTDADRFVAGLDSARVLDTRIEARETRLEDLHPAHRGLFEP
jgi:hypothetical protein